MSTSSYAVAALTLGGGIVLGEPFVHVWLGPRFAQAAVATEVLSVSLLINTIAMPWYFYLVGRGQRRLLARSALVNMSTNLVCTATLTPTIGLWGALAGCLSGNFFGVALLYMGMRRERSVPWVSYIRRPAAVAIPAIVTGSVLVHLLTPYTWPTLLIAAAIWTGVVGCALVAVGASPLEAIWLRAPAPRPARAGASGSAK